MLCSLRQKFGKITLIHNFGAKSGTFPMSIPDFGSAGSMDVVELLLLLRDRVRHERRRQGHSQAEFAAICGIALRTYKRYELTGSGSIEVLVRIAKGFGRAPGFDSIFPAQPLIMAPRGMEAALASLSGKIGNGPPKMHR